MSGANHSCEQHTLEAGEEGKFPKRIKIGSTAVAYRLQKCRHGFEVSG